MNKAILTQEQANAIEYGKKHHTRHDLIDAYMGKKGRLVDELAVLNKQLSYDDFFRALYIGYEVKPEYKVGDYVITKGYSEQYDGKILLITRISKNMGNNFYYFEPAQFGYENFGEYDIERYATTEEIAEEKERRWWAKHGRKVKEIRKRDIIYSYSTGITFVTNDNKRYVTNYDGFRVICFAENRLDVSIDE